MRRAKLQHPAEFIKRQTTKQAFVPIHGTDRQMDERIAALLNAALWARGIITSGNYCAVRFLGRTV